MEGGENDNIADIRFKSRLSNNEYRSKKRSMAYNSSRINLDSISKDLEIPSIAEISKLSLQFKKKKDFKILHRIRVGLSVGGESITAFLNTEGALYALVGCLTGRNEDLQREAICTVINLGLGSKEQCEKVYKAVGVYLTFGLTGQPSDLQDPYAWGIGNLCGGNKSVCNEMISQGTHEVLYELLGSYNSNVVQSAAYALTHFIATVPQKLEFMKFKVLGRAVSSLEKCDIITADIVWLIFILSCDPMICETLVMTMNIITIALCSLQQVINRENLDVCAATALVRILINCFGAVPHSISQVTNGNPDLFVNVSKSLLYSPYVHLRMETVQMVANVINGVPPFEQDQLMIQNLNLKSKLDSAMRNALAAKFKEETLSDLNSLFTLM